MSIAARARVAFAYRLRHGRWPNLDRPRRFTEWVQWRKLFDRDGELARLTDKSHSKEWAASMLDADYLIPTVWRGTLLPERPPGRFPLIVKANHGCNQFRVVLTDDDWTEARMVAPYWLRNAYGTWLDEWHYGAADRSLIVEPYLGQAGTLPLDYKIYTFGGRVSMIQVHEGRGSKHRWSQWGREWQPLSANAKGLSPPPSLDAMIAAAEQLTQERDFLRVDFYDIGGQAKFGEFCLFPGSGLDPFRPDTLDDWLGDQWSAQRPSVTALASPFDAGPAPAAAVAHPMVR